MDGNYIKLSRGLLEWEWYTDINTTRLFIHMLLKANWKDGNFKGTTVSRGSFVSSIGKLAGETYGARNSDSNFAFEKDRRSDKQNDKQIYRIYSG